MAKIHLVALDNFKKVLKNQLSSEQEWPLGFSAGKKI
jgi:hypothetical protein